MWNSKALRTGILIIVTALIALGCQELLGWDALTVLAVEALLLACYAVA